MLVQRIVLFVIFSLSTLVAQSQSFEELIMGSGKILSNSVPKDENGVLNGKGVIFWASGDVYERNLTDGLFQGYGELTLKDESKLMVRAGEPAKVPLKHVHSFSSLDEDVKAVVFRVHEKGQPDRILVE